MVSHKIDTVERVLVKQTGEVFGQCDRNSGDLHRLQGALRDAETRARDTEELAALALHRAAPAHEVGDQAEEQIEERFAVVREVALEAQQRAASLGENFPAIRQKL